MPSEKSSLELTKEALLEEEPVVNLGDQYGMKRMLDEQAVTVLALAGYSTDWALWNLKMVLGAISCVAAALAQFWPTPWPGNWLMVFVSVGVYYVAGTVLQYLATFKEQEFFAFTLPKENEDGSLEPGPGIALSSDMERYDHLYTLVLSPGPKSGSLWGTMGRREEERSVRSDQWSLQEFFDTDGHMAYSDFEEKVVQLLKAYEGGGKKSK